MQRQVKIMKTKSIPKSSEKGLWLQFSPGSCFADVLRFRFHEFKFFAAKLAIKQTSLSHRFLSGETLDRQLDPPKLRRNCDAKFAVHFDIDDVHNGHCCFWVCLCSEPKHDAVQRDFPSDCHDSYSGSIPFARHSTSLSFRKPGND